MQQHQFCKQVQAMQVSCHLHLLYGCETWTLLADFEKRIHSFELHEETFPYLLLGPQDKRLGVEQDQLSLWALKNLFWQLSRDPKMAWVGHVTRRGSLSKTTLHYQP